MRWLVAARNEIQNLMADLYERFPTKGDSIDAAFEKRLHLMVGAAFSLWRAVFLVVPEDTERSLTDIGAHARGFLKRVIDTNSIQFGDDLKWQVWSSGYYLNNAKHRILRLRDDKAVQASISTAVLKTVWTDLYVVLVSIISEVPSPAK
jgi:hypothetical protein